MNKKFKTENSPSSIDGFQKTVTVDRSSDNANVKVITGGVDGNFTCWKGSSSSSNDKFWNINLKEEILDSDLDDRLAVAITSSQAFIYNSKGIKIRSIPPLSNHSFRCIKIIPNGLKKSGTTITKTKANAKTTTNPSPPNFVMIENSKDRQASNLLFGNGQRYKIYNKPITTISVNEEWIGFGASDGSVGIWDLKYKTRHVLIRNMHQFAVCSVKITDEHLISGSPDGWIRYISIPPRGNRLFTRTIFYLLILLLLVLIILSALIVKSHISFSNYFINMKKVLKL